MKNKATYPSEVPPLFKGAPASEWGLPVGTGVRRCLECSTTDTPQWREGPLGPKTLCNACGVKQLRLNRKSLPAHMLAAASRGPSKRQKKADLECDGGDQQCTDSSEDMAFTFLHGDSSGDDIEEQAAALNLLSFAGIVPSVSGLMSKTVAKKSGSPPASPALGQPAGVKSAHMVVRTTLAANQQPPALFTGLSPVVPGPACIPDLALGSAFIAASAPEIPPAPPLNLGGLDLPVGIPENDWLVLHQLHSMIMLTQTEQQEAEARQAEAYQMLIHSQQAVALAHVEVLQCAQQLHQEAKLVADRFHHAAAETSDSV